MAKHQLGGLRPGATFLQRIGLGWVLVDLKRGRERERERGGIDSTKNWFGRGGIFVVLGGDWKGGRPEERKREREKERKR